jgi:cytochrome P450
MSALDSTDVLRPGPTGFGKWIAARVTAAIPWGFGLLRRFQPILRLGSLYVVTLHDDVREVYRTDHAFRVPYKDNLDVITGGEPFFLGMADTPQYHAQLDAMRRVARPEDLPMLAARAESMAEAIVEASNGAVEVVGLVRRVTFDLLADYFGVPEPAVGRLDVWATRLFEYQFTGSPKDKDLRAQVDVIARAFRAHIDAEIARRKTALASADSGGRDDIIARCLARQAAGEPGYADVEIRTAVLCMIVGGPPQPPMVVPQAMEQLLRRPTALAAARAAAAANDDARLHDIVLEAMRFDPLAPALPRHATQAWTVAAGTSRQQTIPSGATVLVGFASAMMDDRRLPTPTVFDPGRRPYEYIHFGCGLHECFGRHINHAILHRMLKPLFTRPGLRRAKGPDGRLTKNGIFAERLVVALG